MPKTIMIHLEDNKKAARIRLPFCFIKNKA